MRLRSTRGLKPWYSKVWSETSITYFLRDSLDEHVAQIDVRDPNDGPGCVAGGTKTYQFYPSIEVAKRQLEIEAFEMGYFFLTEAQLNLL